MTIQQFYYLKIITGIIVIFLILPSFSLGQHLPESDIQVREYFALITGCMTFKNTSWNIASKNNTCDHYHRYLYDSLLQSKNWDEENIIFLTDEQATRQAILDSLTFFSEKVDKNDIFLFSFHSHGNQINDENGDETKFDQSDTFDETLAPYDIDVRNNRLINYISDDELSIYLDRFSCEAIIVNIEACFSGGFAEDLNLDSSNSTSTNRFIMLSTPEDHLEWMHPRVAWGWMSSLGFCLSSPFTDQNANGWISTEESYNLASFLYTFRSYTYIHLIPFLSVMAGTKIIHNIIYSILHIHLLPSFFRFILLFFIGVTVVNIIEYSSERKTGYPSSNTAVFIDAYPGELPLIQI